MKKCVRGQTWHSVFVALPRPDCVRLSEAPLLTHHELDLILENDLLVHLKQSSILDMTLLIKEFIFNSREGSYISVFWSFVLFSEQSHNCVGQAGVALKLLSGCTRPESPHVINKVDPVGKRIFSQKLNYQRKLR